MRFFAPLLVCTSIAVLIGACSKSSSDVKVEGILVAQAEGMIPADEAPLVTLTGVEKAADVVLPDGPAVRIAIDRKVSYGEARDLIMRSEAAGKKTIVLVGDRNKLGAIKLNDEIKDPRKAIRLVATPDGKACVSPPDNNEAKCAEQVYSSHVSKASVREFVRDAIKAYQLTEVRVFARPSVEWADVIRAVDGARTCCDGKMFPAVRLVDWDKDQGSDADSNSDSNSDSNEPSSPSDAKPASKAAGSAMGVPDEEQPSADSNKTDPEPAASDATDPEPAAAP